jgi:hypothetical protein
LRPASRAARRAWMSIISSSPASSISRRPIETGGLDCSPGGAKRNPGSTRYPHRRRRPGLRCAPSRLRLLAPLCDAFCRVSGTTSVSPL